MASYEVTVPVTEPVGDEALDKIREVASVSLLLRFEDVQESYDLAMTIVELNRALAAAGIGIEVGKPRRVRTR
jgi:hypothetical protein